MSVGHTLSVCAGVWSAIPLQRWGGAVGSGAVLGRLTGAAEPNRLIMLLSSVTTASGVAV